RCARRPASAGTPMRSTSGPARRTPSPRRSPPATWSAAWPPRRARRSRAPRAVCAEPVQVPDDVRRLLDDLDAFIERELVPLQDRAIQVHGGIGYSRAKAAVDAAQAQALPDAIREGREYAEKLATAAGVMLGDLLTISNAPASPYGPFGYQFGPFGVDQYCGDRRVAIVRRDANGRRRVV